MSRAKNGSNPRGNNQNLVTVLFVLGVIGWGFFAIDRLTDAEPEGKVSKSHGRALGQESGWKRSARDWLNRKLSSSGAHSRESPESVSRNIPQSEANSGAPPPGMVREGIPLLSDPEGLRPAEAEKPKVSGPIESARAEKAGIIYFYRINKKGQPALTGLRRQGSGLDRDLKARIAELIRGPSTAEQDRDYIDSFIRKPRILSAKMEGRCAVVNFDANFGAGVSYQTLRFQIRQLFRNLEAWESAACLELRIGGKYVPYLGTDGLFFPKRIDAAWLKENL